MSDWCIAVASADDDNTPSISEVRKLSEDEHERLSAATATLRSFVARTVYSVLRQNYLSFSTLEKQITTQVASTGSTGGVPPEAIQVLLTTSIMNYLSSMRMYTDLTQKELSDRDASDGSSRLVSWREAASAEYDDYFAYRFLYRFRNYIQHVGLPLSMSELSGYRDEYGNVVGRVLLGESPSHLVAAFDGWSTVGPELVALTTSIDLSEQIHLSIECLDRLEECFMEQFQPELTKSVGAMVEIIGDLSSYEGAPMVARFVSTNGSISIESEDLQIPRFQYAQHVMEQLSTSD